MSEGSAAPATPSNFAAGIAANVARASAPAATPAPSPAVPATGTPAPTGGIRHGVPAGTPAAAQPDDPQAAFDAAIRAAQQPPANDNAAPADPAAELAALQGEQPTDPLAEQVHGLELRAIVEAIKAGNLPSEVLEHVKVVAKVNGRELPISVREAANGYMRLTDYTQETQRAAATIQQIEGVKAQIASLFDNWDKPGDGFEQGMFRMGLVPKAREMVTKNWGTPQQPNPQGLLDDMRRLGHWDTFKRAAELYADQWAAEEKLDPIMRAQLQRDRDEMWKARLTAESEVDAGKRKTWEQERAQLLKQRQQQPPNPQQQQAALKQLNDFRVAEFQRFGLPENDALRSDFVTNYKLAANAARSRREQVTTQELASRATQMIWEKVGDLRAAASAAPAAQQQQAPVQQPAAVASLPARPAAAPVTAPSPLKRGGTPDDFAQRLATLNAMGQRR